VAGRMLEEAYRRGQVRRAEVHEYRERSAVSPR
jgi:hypothetical protein